MVRGVGARATARGVGTKAEEAKAIAIKSVIETRCELFQKVDDARAKIAGAGEGVHFSSSPT